MAPAKKIRAVEKGALAEQVKGDPKKYKKRTINVDTDAFNDFRLIQQRVSSFLGFRLSANQTLQHIISKYPNLKQS